MSQDTRVGHPIYGFTPTDVEGFDSLADVASGYIDFKKVT
jgi:hypothetical protein